MFKKTIVSAIVLTFGASIANANLILTIDDENPTSVPLMLSGIGPYFVALDGNTPIEPNDIRIEATDGTLSVIPDVNNQYYFQYEAGLTAGFVRIIANTDITIDGFYAPADTIIYDLFIFCNPDVNLTGACGSDITFLYPPEEEDGEGDTDARTESALMIYAGNFDSNGMIYVDKDATDGLNNGTSWDDAYLVLEDALDEAGILAANLGWCEVWVAEGTYKPLVESSYETATFRMPPGNVKIRGRFGGKGVYETSPDQRDFNNFIYETVLSGDYGSGNKAYYVVTCDDIGAGLVLDGFTITGSSIGDYMNILGAGMRIDNYSEPSIIRCRFRNNGIYGIYDVNFSYPDVADCVFLENDASSGDASIYSKDSSWPYIKNCIFDGNNSNSYALKGKYTVMLVEDCIIRRQSYSYPEGSIFFENSNLTLTGCKIENNSYSGISCSNSNLEISDCTIRNNRNGINCSSSYIEVIGCAINQNNINGIFVSGASVSIIKNNIVNNNNDNGIYITDCVHIEIKDNLIYQNGDYSDNSGLYLRYSISPPLVRNNTIVENVPYGIYVFYGQDPCLINDIIWGNGTNIFSMRGIEDINASYCCIEGGFPGTGNIDCDPCFRNPEAGDYHLKDESDCIDAGDPLADYEGETDIDGRPRVIYDRVDIGADEWFQAPDYNGDGIINFLDFAIFAQYWLIDAPDISLDLDSDVDIDDFIELCENWLWEF